MIARRVARKLRRLAQDYGWRKEPERKVVRLHDTKLDGGTKDWLFDELEAGDVPILHVIRMLEASRLEYPHLCIDDTDEATLQELTQQGFTHVRKAQYGWRKEPDANLIEDPTDHSRLTVQQAFGKVEELKDQWREIQSEVRTRWPGWRLDGLHVISPDNKMMGLEQAQQPEPYGRDMDPEIAEWAKKADALYDHFNALQYAAERWERKKPIEWPQEVRDRDPEEED